MIDMTSKMFMLNVNGSRRYVLMADGGPNIDITYTAGRTNERL